SRRPAPPDEAALRALLDGLADADGYAAALRGCLAAPDRAVPLLLRRLRPTPIDPRRLARWIADLDDESYEVRSRATEELARHVQVIEPALRRALEDRPSLEMRRRLEELLGKIEGDLSPSMLSSLRAVEALERLGTPAARRGPGEVGAGCPAAAPATR